jgi:hypothetical protein
MDDYPRTVPRIWAWLEGKICAYLHADIWKRGWLVDSWVVVRFLLPVAVLYALPQNPGLCCTVVALLVAAGVILELLLYQTATVLTQEWPVSRLRMLALTFVGYATIGVAFAILYALQSSAFEKSPSVYDLVYFSFITLATIGYGDLSPNQSKPIAQTTVIAEHIIALYYLAVVIVVIVSMTTRNSDRQVTPGKTGGDVCGGRP